MNRNNKIIAFLLTVIMAISAISVPVRAGAANGADSIAVSLEDIFSFQNNQDAEVTFSAKNNMDAQLSAVLITALYEKDSGEMITYTYVADQLSAHAAKEWGMCIPVPASGSYVIKAFAVDTIKSANALSNVAIAEMGDTPGPIDNKQKIDKALWDTAASVLSKVAEPEVGFVGGEWAVLGLARANATVPDGYYEAYTDKVIQKALQEDQKASNVWGNKVTDVERIAIALTSIGVNPQYLDGVDLLSYISNKSVKFPGITPSGELGARQGTNELIYALLALQANDALKQPADAQNSIEGIVDKLLAYAQNGWFPLEKGGEANLDITAMALQALAKNRTIPGVNAAIEASLDKLSKAQAADATFIIPSDNKQIKSVESVVQVIVALTELGMDPATQATFIKNDTTLIDALFSFYLGNGKFAHELGGSYDQMATEQGLYALAALSRFYKDQHSLYNMNDIVLTEGGSQEQIGTVHLSVEKRTIGKGDTLSLGEFDLFKGDSAFDVFKRVLEDNDIPFESVYSQALNSVYIASIDGDGEFDYGASSGWKYQVNDAFPDTGMSQYQLKSSDAIRIRYSVNGGNDSELTEPLINLLNRIIAEAELEIVLNTYTKDSVDNLLSATQNAKEVTEDPAYSSTDTDKELAVSGHIALVLSAINSLVPDAGTPEPGDASVPDDFENDLWLQYDFKELKTGDTASIYPRRTPQVISNPIINDVQRPNFTFEVVEGADVIGLDMVKNAEFSNRNDEAVVTALKPGVAIVKVGYDEFTHMNLQSPSGAVSEVNYGYVAFAVADGDGSGITIDINDGFTSYDTVYFAEGSTVDYAISPIINGADTVKVTLNGKEISQSGGTYTLPLENRTNIVGIKASNQLGDKYEYRMIDARKIEIKVVNLTNPGNPIEAGDSAHISFKGITLPIYKLAKLYNPTLGSSCSVLYENAQLGNFEGKSGQYDLATKNGFAVGFENAGDYLFTSGGISEKWYGSVAGLDKTVVGLNGPSDGTTRTGIFSIMPDFTISVAAGQNRPVTGITIDQSAPTVQVNELLGLTATITPENASDKTISWSTSDDKVATVWETGVVKGLKAGTATITATTQDSGFSDTVTVTVAPEPVATPNQKAALGKLVTSASGLIESEYSADTWSVFESALDAAKAVHENDNALVSEVTTAMSDLEMAKSRLVKTGMELDVQITPAVLYPGSTVTILLDGLLLPSTEGSYVNSIQTVFSSDIPGITTVKSAEARADMAQLRTLEFEIPQDTESGNYLLYGGYINAVSGVSPQPPFNALYSEQFYAGMMPGIAIEVQDADYQIPKGAIAISEQYLETAKIRNAYLSGMNPEGPGDVYYYLASEEHYYKGEKVAFISESQIKAGEVVYDLKNKEIDPPLITVLGETVTIEFTGIDVPIGYIPSVWSSRSGGGSVRKLVYSTDIEGLESAESISWQTPLTTLEITGLTPGVVTLTNGQLFEKENSYSYAIDFGDGQGAVQEGFFGRLPDISFEIDKAGDPYAYVTIEVQNGVKILDNFELTKTDATDSKYRKDVIIQQAFGKESGLTYEDGGFSDVFKSITFEDKTYTKEGGAGSWAYYLNGVLQSAYNTISFVNIEADDEILIVYIPAD